MDYAAHQNAKDADALAATLHLRATKGADVLLNIEHVPHDANYGAATKADWFERVKARSFIYLQIYNQRHRR